MRAVRLAAALILLLWPCRVQAGAWTLPSGTAQILSSVTYSLANTAFDGQSRPDQWAAYRKLLTQLHAEYGWNDWLTLIAAPDWANATLTTMQAPRQRASDFAIEAGARARLWQGLGVFSLQLTAKSAGGFDTNISVSGASGQQIELRAAYGTSFSIAGFPAYLDAEIAQRFVFGRRADEVPFDLTLGVSVTPTTRIMMQGFNVVAEGNAKPPYGYFRLHKLSFSVVRHLWRNISIETGSFIAVSGQNALAERGAMIRLWAEF